METLTIKFVWAFFMLWLADFSDGLYYGQRKVYKIDDYQTGLKQIESSDDHVATEAYFEAIKGTFDLYHRDEKYKNGNICKSTMTQRDLGDSVRLYKTLKENLDRNCTYVIGNVVIGHITNENISFLNTIEEISGYLFVFANTIHTISMNRLKVIRGENPYVFKGKKLAVLIAYNGRNKDKLKYLLLPSLQVILRYNVLIYQNPGMCYIPKKINWDSLIGGESQQVLILESDNNSCESNNTKASELSCHPSCPLLAGRQYCWGPGSLNCQKTNICVHRNCSYIDKCYINEDLKIEECCHDQCAGGCTGPSKKQCLACRNFNNNGDCVEYCPRQFIHDGIRHIVNPHGKLAFNHMCVEKCPVKFFNEFGNCVSNCTSANTYAVNQTCVPCPDQSCPKICRSRDIVKNKEITFLHRKMTDFLENCTVYDGNIEITKLSFEGDEFYDMPKSEFGIRHIDLKKLSKLREIYGHLIVSAGISAPWLTSLLYFKNLRIIRAEAIDSHSVNGLAISNNANLLMIGMKSLKEVRNGDVRITNNPQLCYASTVTKYSFKHKNKIFIGENRSPDHCKRAKCYKECNPKYGCWGPIGFCVKCQHYRLTDNAIDCTSNCSSVNGYFYELKSNDNEKVCSKCHEECKKTKVTCHGPEANQCNFGCQHYMYKNYCVANCPDRYYYDNSSERVCHPCHSACTNLKRNSEYNVCSGPEDYISPFGCQSCNHAMLYLNQSTSDEDEEDYRLKCLHASDICPVGYFKFIVDFRSLDKFSRLYSVLSNNSVIVQIVEKWFTSFTNHEYQLGSICLPCHPHCAECNDASNWHCTRCKYLKLDNKCVDKCSADYFIQSSFNETEDECKPCNSECNEGCSGPTESDCKKCRHVKVYLNKTTNEFFCNSTCGDLVQIFQQQEIICVKSWSIGRLTWTHYIGASVFIFVVVLGLCLIMMCIISCVRKRSSYEKKMKYLNDFYATETDTNAGALPNMATLLLITESQLTREEIIGSGAFGVVYKGIWKPNIDSIDKSNSFLKRNLSRFFSDNSISLLVAVKILTDISDPANNRELLEEAKVMASVDHPCCLRILAVCLTAHPKLITQFMPLGCLLEFCQQHRSYLNNATFLNWSKQIACGMEYLESKGIIHCDLAARNVLVQSPRQVKITDFGLAKMLDHSQQQYQFKGGRMPIKWLAIECIRNRVFSSKSDVWSYGVTLWEMFTFGEKPFPEIKAFNILEHLEKGQRLYQPKICSIDVYTTLIQCWLVDPDARPTFTDLKKTFETMSSNPNRYLLIENADSMDQFFIEWENDAQKYDEFLQSLVTVSQVNSDYDSVTTGSVERKHIRSVRNRYREMRTYRNGFINNKIYENPNEMKKKSSPTKDDYKAIIFDEKHRNQTTGSTWSDYDETKNKRLSSSTTMTNMNSHDYIKNEMMQADLTDDGYLIPKLSYNKESICNYSSFPSGDSKMENVIYSCENAAENEVLINHESSI